LVVLVPTVFWREPALSSGSLLREPASLRDFFARPSARRLLAVSVGITLGGTSLFSISRLILIDRGWSVADVGLAAGLWNTGMVIMGCVAALWIGRGRDMVSVLRGGLGITGLASLGWLAIVMSDMEVSRSLIWLVISSAGFGVGVTAVAIYTLVMAYTRRHAQPGTDFAVIQSGQFLGEAAMISAVTSAAASLGYWAGLSLAGAVTAVMLVMTVLFAGAYRGVEKEP